MTRTTPERRACGTCSNVYTVTANGTIRHHITDNPDFQTDAETRKCRGAGEPPAGTTEALTTGVSQCRLCRHPVQLTDNGRARSHLTPEATPRPCPGGSDFPLGAYPDMVGTTDGLVATLAASCEHVPVGQCYGCHGAAGGPVSDTELDAMAEAEGRGAAPWGVISDTTVHPTMADQLAATPLTTALERETLGTGTVLDVMDGDTRAEAERFMDATRTGGGLSEAERARLDAVVATDHRTLAQKAADAETSRLTREVVKVLQQRSPEEKAETAARMDRVASQALGLPLDPALNHLYTDPSGTAWQHEGPVEICEAPDCATRRQADGRPEGFDPACEKCDTDTHRCPGCGTGVLHGTVACSDCTARVNAERAERQAACTHPDGYTGHDDWDEQNGTETQVYACTHCGAVEPEDDPQVRLGELGVGDRFIRRGTLMSCLGEANGVVQALVLDGPHKGRTGELPNLGEVVERVPAPEPVDTGSAGDGWRTPADTVRDLMPEGVRRLDALRLDCRTCGHPVTPLVEAFDLDGKAKAVLWVCEQAQNAGALSCDNGAHECKPDTYVRLGDLDEGDYFTRRGTLMRLTERESSTSVLAVVVGGPHDGRQGELKNLNETVERAPEPGTSEEETTECTDATTQARQPRSSGAPTPTTARPTTAPAAGSPRATRASAPPVSPKSQSVTSSAPTATAAGKDRTAVATDQSAAAAAFLGSGRPVTGTQGTGAQNPADAAAQFLAGGSGTHGEKETKRDRFGRYLIPHPDTGKETAWTRATTFAKSISDTFTLSQWQGRMTLLGATMRPDIVQRAHGKHVKVDRGLLNDLVDDLKKAAGDKVAANLGTAMHSFTELADRAWHTPEGPFSVMGQIPPDSQPMVGAYIQLLKETGLEPVPHLIEFTTVVKQYGVAGTSDNCYKVTKPLVLRIGRAEVRLSPGEYVIGDKKTGKDLDYGWQEIVIQLALYAQGINAAGVWDRHDEVWHPDPLSRFDKPGTKVRLDAGVVIHLPVDPESEKSPAVYGVDLESGWNAAVLCERVRAWRKVRYLASPVMVSEAETFAPSRTAPEVTSRTTVHPPSLRDKANTVTSKGEASAVWKAAKEAGLPDAEVDELVAVMQGRLRQLAEPGG